VPCTAPKPDEPGTTEIGMAHLDLNLTPSAKKWLQSIRGSLSAGTPILCQLRFFLPLSSAFYDRVTDRTAEPISMVKGTNDVNSCEEVPFEGHVIT
jgi:hypothetical protein